MSSTAETSDSQVLELLRRVGPHSVGELVRATGVTATAVRQRLVRLMAQGLVDREIARKERGRPGHKYRLTEKARRQAGHNFADLAVVLWDEIRAVPDGEVRRGLLQRLARALAGLYKAEVQGATLWERMQSLKRVFGLRGVHVEVGESREMPALTVLDCPYPDLAERDRGVCAMEKMLFAELLGEGVRLASCRFDGHACCEFQTNSA